jgi:hypothetical protein
LQTFTTFAGNEQTNMSDLPKKALFSDQAFKSIKLKKTDTNDKSAPNTTNYLTDAQIHNHIGNLLDYNIEMWYKALGNWTFETEFVAMTVEDARLFQRACQQHLDQTEAGKEVVLDEKIQTQLDKFALKFADAFERMRGHEGMRGVAIVDFFYKKKKMIPFYRVSFYHSNQVLKIIIYKYYLHFFLFWGCLFPFD